jgi:peroxiredoxin
MVEVGDKAPDFTIPKAGGTAYNDVEQFTLSDALGGGPIVLAFVPAAFTQGCTAELCSFRDSLSAFEELDASVYGVSVDLPFAQNTWIQDLDLGFPMLSDWDHELIHAYDVVLPDMYDVVEVAERSVFVLDSDGVVTYTWVREGENPDFDELVDELHDAVAAAAEQ